MSSIKRRKKTSRKPKKKSGSRKMEETKQDIVTTARGAMAEAFQRLARYRYLVNEYRKQADVGDEDQLWILEELFELNTTFQKKDWLAKQVSRDSKDVKLIRKATQEFDQFREQHYYGFIDALHERGLSSEMFEEVVNEDKLRSEKKK